MTLPDDGVYIITNAQRNTVATLSLDFGNVHGDYNSGSDKHRWILTRVPDRDDIYTMQNMRFDPPVMFASCSNVPTKGDNVFGSESSRHWVLKVVQSNIVISSLDAPNFHWSLADSGLATPIVFDDKPTASMDQWIFKKDM